MTQYITPPPSASGSADTAGQQLFYVVLSVAVLSIVAFTIIQLPPGDFVTRFVYQMEQRGLGWTRR